MNIYVAITLSTVHTCKDEKHQLPSRVRKEHTHTWYVPPINKGVTKVNKRNTIPYILHTINTHPKLTKINIFGVLPCKRQKKINTGTAGVCP